MRRHKPKDQQAVQTPAVIIRFYEEDSELLRWLKQFAEQHDMTNVIKLACYMLSGLQPQEGLLALLPDVQRQQVEPTPTLPTSDSSFHEQTSDALAAVMQELSALREEIAQQRTVQTTTHHVPKRPREHPERPPTLPEESWLTSAPIPEPVPVASSGLDVTGPRRKRDRPPEQARQGPPDEAEFDPDEARRRLVASINAYGKGVRRGY